MSKSAGNSGSIHSSIGSALAAALFLIFINVFIMPYNIWVSAVGRLSELKKSGIIAEMRKTELIIFSWLKLLFDSLIVLVVPLLIIAGIIGRIIGSFLNHGSAGSFGEFGGGVASGPLSGLVWFIMIYFSPVFLSLFKEIISIALIQVMKIERIEENTRK